MSYGQFIGIYTALFIIMLITEVGMLTICDRLKTIVKMLEKLNAKKGRGDG